MGKIAILLYPSRRKYNVKIMEMMKIYYIASILASRNFFLNKICEYCLAINGCGRLMF